ncbi:MAG TPA: hypothetical protein VH061_02125 [Solirubrobacteraceae bacterium]|jgi:hypothetical protein|nr:hypothetical protein [Solirubrobacteraceae bacterium]
MLATMLATAALTPVLSVSGGTLSWTTVGAGEYKLSAKAPGTPVVNTTVYGTKYTPAPSPGQTVTFKVKAPGETAWSNKATITYSAERPVEEKQKTQPPTFLTGVNAGTETADLTAVSTLHAKLVRLTLSAPEEGASWLDEWDKRYRERGVQVQPLVTFNGRVLTAAEAKALVGLDRLPGVTNVELGNETSYSYQYKDNFAATSYKERARLYAVRVKETAEVLNPHGIGVLAQAEDGGSGSSTWVKEMFASVPNLSRYVAGWTIHPYSNQRSPSEPDTNGVPKMERMVANLAEQGDTTTPIDVTEWGESSDEGQTLDNGTHLTYTEAAQIAETMIPKLIAAAKRHPIASFLVYKDRDLKAHKSTSEHEAFYGALTSTGGTKGAYTTAIQKLMAE